MCEFFVKADPIQYEQRSRTVRIHGVLTSLRLENLMWDTLAEMAEVAADGLPLFEPGDDWAYSNSNYILLGAIIEEITGRSAADALRSPTS